MRVLKRIFVALSFTVIVSIFLSLALIFSIAIYHASLVGGENVGMAIIVCTVVTLIACAGVNTLTRGLGKFLIDEWNGVS